MVEEKKPLEFPKFPTLFGEEERARLQELAVERQKLREAYGVSFAPGVYEEKPWYERFARQAAYKAHPLEWLERKYFGGLTASWRRLTPWIETGLVPEQADKIIRETEREIRELMRREDVVQLAEAYPDYLLAVAFQGQLTGRIPQLYDIFPQLNPTNKNYINVTEEEKEWFENIYTDLSAKTPEELLDMTPGEIRPFPTGELAALIPEIEPRYILSTVAFSKNAEMIGQALQMAYPPQVEDSEEAAKTSYYNQIIEEMFALGLEPTDDIAENIKRIQEAKSQEAGEPYIMFADDGTMILLTTRDDGLYLGDVKVANIDPDTQEAIPFTGEEEFILDNAPVVNPSYRDTLKLITPELSPEVRDSLWTVAPTQEAVLAWARQHIDPELSTDSIMFKTLLGMRQDSDRPMDLISEAQYSYRAGLGDILTVAGGATRWMGVEGVANWFYEHAAEITPQLPPRPEFDEFRWSHLVNPSYWSTRVTRVLPFTLSLLPVAIFGWVGGAAIGGAVAGKLALGAFGTKLLAAVFGGVVGGATARSLESAMEAGSSFDRALDMGASLEEADAIADEVFWKNMTLAGVDALQVGVAFLPISTPVRVLATGIRRGLFVTARIGGKMTIVGLTEAGEEYYQAVIERQARGEEDPWAFDPEAQEAAALGGIMGIGMGGGGAVLSDVINRTKTSMTPEQQRQFEADKTQAETQALAQGATAEQAETISEAAALNKFAETPEGSELIERVAEVVKEQEFNNLITNPEAHIHTEEVAFLQEEYRTNKEQITVFRTSYDQQVQNLERDLLPYEKVEIQETITSIQKNLTALNTRNKEIDVQLGRLEAPVAAEAVAPGVTNFNIHDTGLATYNSLLSDPVAYLKENNAVGEIRQMTPDEYMAEISEVLGETPAQAMKYIDAAKVTRMAKRLSAGEQFPMPVIARDIKGQEGRHRVLAAKEAGIERVPVLIVSPATGTNADMVAVNALKEVLAAPIPKAEAGAIAPLGWDSLSQAEKLSRTIAAGIAKTAVNKSWSELTSTQQGKLQEIPFLTKEARAVDSEGLSPEEILAGKHINNKVRKEQLEDAPPGTGEAPVDVEELRELQVAAEDFFREQLFAADQDNSLSVALIMAAKTQNIKRYVELLPPDLRDPLPQEFLDATFNTPSRWSLNFQQPVDAATDIDWGGAQNTFRMKAVNPGIQAQQASLMFQETESHAWTEMMEKTGINKPHFWQLWSKKDFHRATFKLGEQIGEIEMLIPSLDILAREDIAAILEGYTEEQQLAMIDYMKGTRETLNRWLGLVNLVRVKMDLEPINFLPNYLTHVRSINIWGKFFGIANKPEAVADIGLTPDLQKPSKVYNPRALAREGGLKDYELEMNVSKLVMDYLGVISKEMFYNPVIQRNKALVRNLREKGYDTIAGWFEDLTLRRFAGVPDPVTRWRQENITNWLWKPLMLMRGRLNPAVFGLNFPWNLIVQTSSFNFLWAMVEPKYVGKATLDYMFNPAIRQQIDKEVPSFIVKQKGRGSITFQDIGHSVGEYRKAVRSPLETIDDWVTIITKVMERYLQGISARAGWLQGEAIGKTGTDLVAYASDIAARSQSEYDLLNLPLVYGAPEVRVLFPFQTFMFTCLTRIREHTSIRGLRAGEWATVDAPLDKRIQALLKDAEGKDIPIDSPAGRATLQVRMRHLLAFLAGIYITNIIGSTLIGREPWEEGSFMPFSNLLGMTVDPRNTWHLPLPLRYGNDFWNGIDAAIEYGNFEPLINDFCVKYFAPAGFELNRAFTYMDAANKGEYQNVAGDTLFEVEGFKAKDWKAWFQGVWYTESGREYYERNIEGIEPETRIIIRDIRDLELQLGTVVDDKDYTLRNYYTDALAMAKKFDVPEWQIIDDITPYPDLLRFALQTDYALQEYYSLPDNQRATYRRANPWADGLLIFWERVESYRSLGGKEEWERLRDEWIPDSPRAHWTGLERIPEDLKFEME